MKRCLFACYQGAAHSSLPAPPRRVLRLFNTRVLAMLWARLSHKLLLALWPA